MGLDKNIRQVIGGIGRDPDASGARVSSTAQVEEMDFNRLMNAIWRSKMLVMLMVFIGAFYALLQLQGTTPLYTATTKVLWEVEEQNVSGLEGVLSGPAEDYRLLLSQIEVILSGRLMGRVVDEMKLVEDPDFNPNLQEGTNWTRWISPYTYISGAIGLVKDALAYLTPAEEVDDAAEVGDLAAEERQMVIDMVTAAILPEWEGLTYVMNIEATAPDPAKAARLADEVARLYILDQLETKFEATRQATDWLSARVADLRVELEDAENRVEEFSSGTTLVSEEALALLSRQLKELRERGTTLGADATKALADRAAIEKAWADGDYLAIGERLRDQRLIRLASEIAGQTDDAVRDGMIERFGRSYELALDRLTLDNQRALEQQTTVTKSVAALEERIEEQSLALVEQRQLMREAEASRLIYEFFLGRLKEISIQEGIQRPDARILTPARVPLRPSYPSKFRTVALGGFAGLVLGFLMAFMIEQRNTSFRTSRDIEGRTGQAVIGTIPMAPVSRRSKLLQYLTEKPTSAVAEAFRNLRTSILLANVDNPPQVIMTTSSMPGEGKTTCCVALAQISRAMGKRVLIVECDIRRRTFQDYFDITGEYGLLSVLDGSVPFEEAVEYDEASGVFVLAGQRSTANAADVFASQRFADFIDQMRQAFDFVFIDTPPVLAVPDARVIARQADAVIFAVRWNRTPRDVVQEGLRQFEQIGVKLAGIVLSQINMRKLRRYGRDFGHYREAAKYYTN